jgi:hypothetical protein
MNLTSLAFLPTTHARAVDGNHHCPGLLCPGCTFSVVGRREVVRERMPHRLFSVLEGSLLTSKQGPISFLTLRSQSALPLNEGTHCILGRNNASIYVFRRSGTRPWLHGLAVQGGAESPKIIIITNGREGGFTSSRALSRYNVAQITTHSFSVLHATMSFKAVRWLRASLTVHNHNQLQKPCCGSMDLRASYFVPSKCVYQRARSYAGRCNIQRLCMHMQYLSAHEDRFSTRTLPPSVVCRPQTF